MVLGEQWRLGEIAVLSSIRIDGGIPLEAVAPGQVAVEVGGGRHAAAGYDIIEGKGCTSFGITVAGRLGADLQKAIIRGERPVLPV